MDAAHQDGNRANNIPGNLRWATRAANEADKKGLGLDNAGERNGMSRLTSQMVRQLRQEVAELPTSAGGSYIRKGAIAPLVAKYGISAKAIRLICNYDRWAHIE